MNFEGKINIRCLKLDSIHKLSKIKKVVFFEKTYFFHHQSINKWQFFLYQFNNNCTDKAHSIILLKLNKKFACLDRLYFGQQVAKF